MNKFTEPNTLEVMAIIEVFEKYFTLTYVNGKVKSTPGWPHADIYYTMSSFHNQMSNNTPRRRLAPKWKSIEFPQLEIESLLDLDLTLWAASNEADMVITNGTMEFPAHKRVLCGLSMVMKEMLEEDMVVSEMTLPDISDTVLEYFYNVIYDTPSQRKERNLNKVLEVYQALKTASKYDIEILRQCLKKQFTERYWNNGSCFQILWDCYESFNWADIGDIYKRQIMEGGLDMGLEFFMSETVMEMINGSSGGGLQPISIFAKACQYAKWKGRGISVDELKKNSTQSNAWKRKYHY